jgi:hypothetical protein
MKLVFVLILPKLYAKADDFYLFAKKIITGLKKNAKLALADFLAYVFGF